MYQIWKKKKKKEKIHVLQSKDKVNNLIDLTGISSIVYFSKCLEGYRESNPTSSLSMAVQLSLLKGDVELPVSLSE